MPPFPRLRIAALDDLAKQLRFAPAETLRRQMERAEALAGEIDPAINYPEDWIVFRITGYRPELAAPATVVGEALLGDISGLVERLSAAARVSHAELKPGEWLDAEGICSRWKISRKTLERWRRLGLIARRVRGENGKPRLAFPVAAVERFEKSQRGRIDEAGGYSRIGEAMEARMVRRAGSYARLGCSLNQAAGRIAERYGRALETVRQLIKRSEAAALFDERGWASERERRLMERAWWLGIEPRDIGRRLGRSTASVLRVVNDARAERLRWVLEQGNTGEQGGGSIVGDAEEEGPSPAPPSGRRARARARAAANSHQESDGGSADRVLESEPVAQGLGAPGETDLLEFVKKARTGGAPIGVEEKARGRAYHALMRRARMAAMELPRRGVSGAAVDAIETDLRWATRLKVELMRSQLPSLVRSLEAAAGRRLEEIRSGLLVELVRAGLGAIGEAIEAFDPEKGGRLAAAAGMAVQRAAVRVLRERGAELEPGSGRAVPRLGTGFAMGDWTRRVSAWQSWDGSAWLEPFLRVRAGAAGLDGRLRRVLELRYGWGPRPMTIAELGRELKMPAMRAAVVERRAVREARRGEQAKSHK